MQISHDTGSHDPDPGPQEKSMKKSCVSFETECRINDLTGAHFLPPLRVIDPTLHSGSPLNQVLCFFFLGGGSVAV